MDNNMVSVPLERYNELIRAQWLAQAFMEAIEKERFINAADVALALLGIEREPKKNEEV